MVVANDVLWFPDCLKAENVAAKPLADLVSHVQKLGFTVPLPAALLKRIADPTLPTADGQVSTEPSVPSLAGDAELNVLGTIIGYSQAPRLLEATGRNGHYLPVLEACLNRMGTRLQYENQFFDQAGPLADLLTKDADGIRDLLFIYFETDCCGRWPTSKDLRMSLQAAALRVFNRLHLALDAVRSKIFSTAEEKNETSSPAESSDPTENLLSSSPSFANPFLAALADFVTFESPFKNGKTMDARLDLVYRSPTSDAILPYLPNEKDVREFISCIWKPHFSRPKDPYMLDPLDKNGSFGAALRIMTHAATCAWVCAPSADFPSSMQKYTPKQRKTNYRKVRRLSKKANDISKVLDAKRKVQAEEGQGDQRPAPSLLEGTQSSWIGRLCFRLAACTFLKSSDNGTRKSSELKRINRKIAAVGLGLESELGVMELGIVGMFTELRTFSERIAKEEPEISNTEGERQAVTNLWACFGLETILFQQRPRSNNAIFGFSMIYPKTDNFLDNNEVTTEDKIAFQEAFHKRIRGDTPPEIEGNEPLKKVLVEVSDLVGAIEKHWPRDEYPSLYLAALAMNTSQTLSVSTQRTKNSGRRKIMETSFYKGGISVATDSFLVQGDLTLREVGFSFVLGCCLQMMDDLQDVSEDMKSSHETLFTPKADKKVPDDVQAADANGRRLFWFLSQVWLSQEQRTDGQRTENMVHRTTSSQRNDLVIKTTLRISQMMALKALFRGQSIFSQHMLREASKRCSVEPSAILKLHGLSFLHKMAKMDQI